MAGIDAAKRMDNLEAGESVFRFMDLPGEQRNSIYRHLFNDITTPDRPFHVEKSLPRFQDLKTYRSLLLTSHQVKHETSTIFEKEYLPHLTFYADDLAKLVRLSGNGVDTALKQAGARFYLRSPSEGGSSVAVWNTPTTLKQGHSPPPQSPRVYESRYMDDHLNLFKLMNGKTVGQCRTHDGLRYDYYTLVMPDEEQGATLFGRELEGTPLQQWVSILEGRICDAEWKHDDQEVKNWTTWKARRDEVVSKVFQSFSLPEMDLLW